MFSGRKLSSNDLQLLLLALLAEKPAHGYELIRALEERSGGAYAPSPGMIYPALTYLEELGHAEADGLATNATYEQARRIGAAAFYLLALGPDTRDDGLRLLTRLSPADQADAAAWAMQTLCERAVRRPADAPTITAARADLAASLAQRDIAWTSLTRGTFVCPER